MEVYVDAMQPRDITAIENDFNKNFDKFWSINILKNDFENENSKYIVAKINDNIVGFAGIKVVLDEADIMNIVVKTNMRHRSIGSILLEELTNLAKNSNCKTITLEVNEHNLIAIRLYEKYNFKRIGLRKKYYNNTDDAILMRKDI